MSRAFIAIKIKSTRTLDPVLAQLRQLGRPIRAVRDDQLHTTLSFLGPTDDRDLPSVADAVRASVQGVRRFEIKLTGLGAFPNIDRPGVVWVGIHDTGPLPGIVDQLRARLADSGFPVDSRPWTPHVTIARVKGRPPPQLKELIRSQTDREFGVIPVRRVDLMLSDLSRRGPEYTTAKRFELP